MIPAVLGTLRTASAGAAIAPALQMLNVPFMISTVLMLGRAWYLELDTADDWSGFWAQRSRKVLIATTVVSVAIWGLRLGGLLGGRPF